VDEAAYSLSAAKASLAAITADVKAAETNIDAAKAGVRRARADVTNAKANVKVAEATLARSQTMARYASLKAPFDGLITYRGVDHGDYVVSADKNSAAMPLFELTRTNRVRVAVGVPTTNASKVAVGQKAVFRGIGGMSGREFVGEVARTAGVLDAKTRSLRIEVDFTNPVKDVNTGEEIELQPGLFGTLTIVRHEWDEKNQIPVVPTSAVGTDSGRKFVVVQKDGKLIRRFVDVAFNDAVNVGIGRGISVGEKVVAKNPSAY
jgi:RND family efflux transporter MFP subunit